MQITLEQVLEIIENRRMKVLLNPSDPSWTEHFAELQNELRELWSDSLSNVIEITLAGEFITLNDYILAERGHYHAAAKIKRNETQRIQYDTIGILPVPLEYYPMVVSFFWYRKNSRTDPDNIAFSKKFILDGLQKSGIIRNDTFNEIRRFVDYFMIDADNPRVVVRFEKA